MQHAVGGRAPGGHLAGRGGAAGGQVKALAAHVARRESGSAEGLRGKEGEDAGAQEVSGSGKGNAAQPAPSSRSSCWSARSKGPRRARRGRPPLQPRRRQGPRPRREEGCARAQPRRRGEAKRRQTRRRRPRLSHRRPLPQRGSGAPVPWGCPDGREPRGTRLIYCLLNSEFGCVQCGLILLLWDLGRKKQSACRKQWLNHLGQQMKWQLQETPALQVEFSSILPTDGYRLSLFGRGPIALHRLVHFLNTIGPSLTKVIYAYFDRISYIYIYDISIYVAGY